jgi:hypothetical protein
LFHPDSSTNLIRRAKTRIDESKDYFQAINEIEYSPGLKPENPACPREAQRTHFAEAKWVGHLIDRSCKWGGSTRIEPSE